MTDYSEFRIRIERGQQAGQYRVEASGRAGNGSGTFEVPFSDDALENFVLKVGQTRRGVRSLESPQFEAAKEFGAKLFGAVMRQQVAELYRSSFSLARAEKKGTRITLALTDVPELAEIPWEYLFDAPNFLAISTSTPVVRYLDVAQPPRALETALPIRILGVVSAPTDYEHLDAAQEQARLTSALKPLIDANAVSIDWLETATLPALTKKLQPDTYHILHFIGHGGFDKSTGKGALLFEDDTSRGRAISGEQLATILHDKASLRLVFLNSCEGARTSIKDPFSGVAASLIEREIPAVIAMQFEITDRAAIIFGGEFYAMLAEGQPVDAAVTQARLLVFADDNDVEWGTPVLFLRVEDGRLFDVSDASTLPRVPVEELPPKVAGTAVEAAEPGSGGGVEAGPAVVVAADGGGAGTGERSDPPSGAPLVGGLAGAAAIAGAGGGGGAAGDGGVETGGGAGDGDVETGGGADGPPTSGGGSEAPPGAGTGGPTGGPPEPPSRGPAEPPAGGTPTGGPPSDGPPPTGPGGGGGTPTGPVGPTVVTPGPNLRPLAVAAAAIIGVLVLVLLVNGGRPPWDPGGSQAQASVLPSGSASIPPATPTATVTTQPTDTPPPTTKPSVKPASPIHIAVEVVDVTGTNSRGVIDGVKLAVKDAGGAVGGVPVTVPDSLIFDDDSKAANGKDIIEKVIDDEDVVALVGPYNSSVAAAQIPISNKAGLLECSPSATSETLTKPEAGARNLRPSRPDAINFVRTVTTNDLDPIGAAMYLIDGLARNTVYIVDDGVPSAVARSDRFQAFWESRGATVVGRASVPPDVTDYSTLVIQMKAAGADSVYFSGSPNTSANTSNNSSRKAARLLKAMNEAGLAIPFMGSGEIFDGTTSKKNSFLNLAAGTAGTGVYMSYPAAGDYTGRKAFEDKFELAYGHSPSLYAITAYACTQAILDALSRTDLSVDRRDLRDAVRASTVDSRVTYQSAMGDFRFDENGDTTLQIITIYDFETGAKDWKPVTYIDVPDQ